MLHVVGLGPGNHDLIAPRVLKVIQEAEVVSGYTVYLDLIKDLIKDKEIIQSPMKQEVLRTQLALDAAESGKKTVMVCSGDPGIYGMAGLCYELKEKKQMKVEINVIPGISAANSAAAVLGAPLIHDFAVISLSDLLTPLDEIMQRVKSAIDSGFVIVLYNPTSKKRFGYLQKVIDIALNSQADLACGYVKNIERENQIAKVMMLSKLDEKDIDMFTTVIIGNKNTRIIDNNLVTPRGYNY
ncbi:precorrin-3B C(17)-methyltransferase [Mycoplasma sp. P36-A1]|uniref:precorrin-3B C(17)-methyltransferase n=1 Tax=Mycoplasma sp. P36-A1 TaxID=3252900 RepID=UPI003C2E1E67